MPLGEAQLWGYLGNAQRVLIAGAGGGCDVYCALPIYLACRDRGVDAFLGNLSFTDLEATDAKQIDEALYEVTADSDYTHEYYPEHHLCSWFRERNEQVSVYTFARTGVAPLIKSYRKLAELLRLDAIILVDGGTDALMRGDEFHLATPEEDQASIIAAASTRVGKKALLCTAFGVDAYHGICHAHFLENVAYYMQKGGYLGTFSADPGMPEVSAYLDAVKDLCKKMPRAHSIVNTSMASAIEGHYGDYHCSHRTAGSRLWINPMMSLYWAFELDRVYRRLLYRAAIRKTQTYRELSVEIGRFRAQLKEKREFEDIPV